MNLEGERKDTDIQTIGAGIHQHGLYSVKHPDNNKHPDDLVKFYFGFCFFVL